MPDWLIHIGVGHLTSQKICREYIPLALIGSVLPDIISRINVILIDVFRLFIFENFSFISFHTPFMVACVSLSVALLNTRPVRIFVILFGFGLLHLLLDMLEIHVPGIGVVLFFPFSYEAYSFNLFTLSGIGYYIIYGIFLLLLLLLLLRKHSLSSIRWTRQRLCWALPLFLFLLLFPFYADRLMLEHNVGYRQFYDTPELWEGKKLSIHVARVISTSPLTVGEDRYRFEVVTDSAIKVGQWISIHGTYLEGRIIPEIIIMEIGPLRKSLFSIIGLLYLMGFFILQWKKHRFGSPSQR